MGHLGPEMARLNAEGLKVSWVLEHVVSGSVPPYDALSRCLLVNGLRG